MMRILVIALPVPDSRATVRVAGDGVSLETKGLKFVCNPFDEFAIEQAVQLKEARGDVEEIVVMALGGPNALLALRTALAMGADRGVHVDAADFAMHDEVGVARALAAAVKLEEQAFDLIFCGKQTIDNDSGELGPALAEFLGMAHAGAVVEFVLDDAGTRFAGRRRIEGAEEVLEGGCPALITCEKGLVEPRFPSLPNLMKAKKKPMVTLTVADLGDAGSVGSGLVLKELAPPAARAACRMLEGEPAEMAGELANLLRTEAKVI